MEKIYEYIKKYSKEEYKDIIKKDGTLETVMALSEIRTNLINWYPFFYNTTILQMGANYGEITEELSKKVQKVEVWEPNKEKREIIKIRTTELENIKVLEQDPMQQNKKYDYIIIENIEEQNETFEKLINWAKTAITKEGVILASIENKLGLKMLNGINLDEKNKKRLTKKEIEKILEKENISNTKFYYPLPNSKMPNVIFTDKHLPTQESILRDLTLYDDQKDILGFEERNKYIEILKEDKKLFPIFANSFFIEISNKTIETDINYVTFGNSRKPQYRLKTIMGDKEVIKQAVNEKAKQHINLIAENIKTLKKLGFHILDTYENETVHSRLILEEKSYDKKLKEIYKKQGKTELIKKIKQFYEEISSKLTPIKENEKNIFEKYKINIDKNEIKKLHFIKEGIFDLIFQNSFFIEEKFYFYDQEWKENNLPLEFILYRAIWYLCEAEKSLPKQELLQEFGLLKWQEKFEELENKLQEQVKDETIWKIHGQNNKTIKQLYDTYVNERNLKAQTEIEKTRIEKNLTEKINEINRQKEEIQQELNYIKNSKSWKITRPLRLIRKKIK